MKKVVCLKDKGAVEGARMQQQAMYVRSVCERYECDARCETAKKQEKCWD